MTDWIEHDGNGIPVDEHDLVIVKFRDGDEESVGEQWEARCWGTTGIFSNWVHDVIAPCEADIIAYKVIK